MLLQIRRYVIMLNISNNKAIILYTDFLAACLCRLLHLNPVHSAPVGRCSDAAPANSELGNCAPAMDIIWNRPSAGASTTLRSLRLIRTFSVPFCRWSYVTTSSAFGATGSASGTATVTATAAVSANR